MFTQNLKARGGGDKSRTVTVNTNTHTYVHEVVESLLLRWHFLVLQLSYVGRGRLPPARRHDSSNTVRFSSRPDRFDKAGAKGERGARQLVPRYVCISCKQISPLSYILKIWLPVPKENEFHSSQFHSWLARAGRG